jgi:hypothetical protein
MPRDLFVESLIEPWLFSKAEVDTIRLTIRATNRSDDSLGSYVYKEAAPVWIEVRP